MEYVEYFFGNFWHWLGGLFYLALICGVAIPSIFCRFSDRDNGDDNDKEE